MTISIPKDFQTENWTEEELDIFRQFRFRCIRCRADAVVLHELEPKSQTKNWKKSGNRVPLCENCHEFAHKFGTKYSRIILIKYRDRRLEQYAD